MTPQRAAVLVVGPPLAGVDGVVTALGAALPDHVVAALDGPASHASAGLHPAVVVVVVSAVAPVTRTEWDVVERAAAASESVIAVVSKIDAHRTWRNVLATNRAIVAGWHARRRAMPWVGVAAAPDLGEPRLDELLVLLRDRLTDARPRRIPPPANEVRLPASPSPTAARRPRAPAVEAAELRSALQHARLRLLRFVREGCSTMRVELREEASAVAVGGIAHVEAAVHERATRFLALLDAEITHAVADAAAQLAIDGTATAEPPARPQAPPDLSRSPSSSRALEGRLMAVLGAGFGLGIALASSRLLAGLARGPSLLGLAVGLVVGLALVIWVVRTRGLLHDRALLDRWVTEVTSALRWHGEAVVAERLLGVESRWVRARADHAAGGAFPTGHAGRKRVTDQYEW